MEQLSKKEILEKIKNNEKPSYEEVEELSLEDLLTKDETNIPYLVYCKKNDFYLSYDLENQISNNKQALYICTKYNCLQSIDIEDENVLFEKVEENKTLIEYMFEQKEAKSTITKKIKNHVEIIDLILKYKIKDIYWAVSDEIIEKLFTEENGKFIYDKYKDNKSLECLIIKVPKEKIINYCTKTQNYELLKYCNEETLLTNHNNKTILEELLEKNIDPLFYNYDFKEKKTIDILIKKNKTDLLYNASIEILLEQYDENKNYLEFMIQEQKQEKKINLEKKPLIYWMQKPQDTAREIIIFTKNDMLGYIIDRITLKLLKYKDIFIDNSKTILEYLLEMDKELTLKKIIPKVKDRIDPEFAIFLRSLGIDDSDIKIKTNEINFSDEYTKYFNDKYDKDCTSEYEILINELKELFYNDGKSEKEYIDLLIKSYRYMASVNNQYGIIELKHLIDIKKENYEKFTYIKSEEESYFSMNDKNIVLDQKIISTINHETSHALHYFLSNNYVPENYNEVIERARNNKETINKVMEYSKKYIEIKEKIIENISKSDIANYYDKKYKGEKLEKLKEFLQSSKEEKKEQLKDEYPEEVLDIILEKMYTPEEFIEQRKKIEIKELTDSILRNEYDAFIAIGDIIDAIFKGKFKNNVLFNKEGIKIESAYGHGIDYYSNEIHGMDEMIANYGSIMKSKNAKETIELLRKIVGNEVVDMIKEVYENHILASNIYVEEERINAR